MPHIKIDNPPKKQHPNWVLWYIAAVQTVIMIHVMVR